MAYAEKYYHEYYSDKGTLHRLEIHQDGYGGAASLIKMASSPVVRQTGTQGDNPYNAPVCGSEIQLNIIIQTNYQLRDLVTTDEDEFYVYHKRWNGSSFDVIWQGYLITDGFEEAFTDVPYPLTLRAVDGLARLKRIDYDPGYTSTAGKYYLGVRRSFFQVIRECLDNAAALAIEEYVNIYSDAMSTPTSATMLNQAFVDPQRYLIEEPGYNSQGTFVEKFSNCYDVLAGILKTIGARVWIDTVPGETAPSWHIGRMSEARSGATVVRKLEGLSSGNPATTTGRTEDYTLTIEYPTGADWLTKNYPLSQSPRLRWINPYKEVIIAFQPGPLSNKDIVRNGRFAVWDLAASPRELEGWTDSESPVEHERQFTFRDSDVVLTGPVGQYLESTAVPIFSGGGANEIEIIISNFKYIPQVTGTWLNIFINTELRARITLDAGGGTVYYLYFDSATNEYDWKTSADTVLLNDTSLHTGRPEDWSTKILLPDDGDFQIRLYQATDQTRISAPSGSTTNRVFAYYSDVEVNISIDDTVSQEIIRINEEVTDNTTIEPITVEVIHGDQDIALNSGHITDASGDLTENWSRRGATDNLTILELLLKDIISQYKQSKRILTGTFRNNEAIQYGTILKITDNSATVYYACTYLEEDFANNTVTGEWIEILDTSTFYTGGGTVFTDKNIPTRNTLPNEGIGDAKPSVPVIVKSTQTDDDILIHNGNDVGDILVIGDKSNNGVIIGAGDGTVSPVFSLQPPKSGAVASDTYAAKLYSSFAASSGSARFRGLIFNNVISQTGGTGVTGAIYINDSLTTPVDYRAIEIATNTGKAIYQSGASATNYFAGNTGFGTQPSTVSGHNIKINTAIASETAADMRLAPGDNASRYVRFATNAQYAGIAGIGVKRLAIGSETVVNRAHILIDGTNNKIKFDNTANTNPASTPDYNFQFDSRFSSYNVIENLFALRGGGGTSETVNAGTGVGMLFQWGIRTAVPIIQYGDATRISAVAENNIDHDTASTLNYYFRIDTATAGVLGEAARWNSNKVFIPAAQIRAKSYTYAARPTTGIAAGDIIYITDSNTATWGATVAGGGANKVLAWYNGTNWTVTGI